VSFRLQTTKSAVKKRSHQTIADGRDASAPQAGSV
jgi:hypothetical protein